MTTTVLMERTKSDQNTIDQIGQPSEKFDGAQGNEPLMKTCAKPKSEKDKDIIPQSQAKSSTVEGTNVK